MVEFQCDACGSRENSSHSEGGHLLKAIVREQDVERFKEQLKLSSEEEFGRYCSACSPLGDGIWHGKFQRWYLAMGEYETTYEEGLVHKKTRKRPTIEDCIAVEGPRKINRPLL